MKTPINKSNRYIESNAAGKEKLIFNCSFFCNQSQLVVNPIQRAQAVSIIHLGSSLGATKGNTRTFIIKGKLNSGARSNSQ
ncbi:MAG: hypothetical protein R8M14_03045 [Ghiorsea sp.]